LKVDRSFVCDVTTNFRHGAIVHTVTGFAESLGLRLSAECVDSEDQATLLRSLGCALAQGNLYSPPIPAEEMELLLRDGLRGIRLQDHNDGRANAVA